MIAWDEAGSGPPLVLVHGLTEDRRAWDSLLPRLTDDFRCIRLDLRNHGESPDAEDGSALAMAEDVAEVVAAAAIEEPPLLVGHSLGAVVVTAYANQAPAAAVVNVDQSLRFGDFAMAVQPIAPLLRGPEFGDTITGVFDVLGMPALPPEVAAYLDERHRSVRQEVVLGAWDLVLDTPPEELTALAEQLLPAIASPYLAIHGSDPGPDYADWLTAHLPGAAIEVWEGGSHYPHLAEPERFARRVIDLANGLR